MFVYLFYERHDLRSPAESVPLSVGTAVDDGIQDSFWRGRDGNHVELPPTRRLLVSAEVEADKLLTERPRKTALASCYRGQHT